MRGKRVALGVLIAVMLAGAAGLALTAGSGTVDMEAAEADDPTLPDRARCEDIDTGGVLRASAAGIVCAYGEGEEVRLVATCRVTGGQRESPSTPGPFVVARFETQPCAFGVRDAELYTGAMAGDR